MIENHAFGPTRPQANYPVRPLRTCNIHEAPDIRESYAPHGLKRWYVGGSPKHYPCFDIWCPNTRRVRQGETVRSSPMTMFSQASPRTKT